MEMQRGLALVDMHALLAAPELLSHSWPYVESMHAGQVVVLVSFALLLERRHYFFSEFVEAPKRQTARFLPGQRVHCLAL
jgi:hypothetical protein